MLSSSPKKAPKSSFLILWKVVGKGEYLSWLEFSRSRLTCGRVATNIIEAGQTAIFVRADVTKAVDWQAAMDKALAIFGTIDILVNNAGWTYRRKDSLDVTEAEYDRKEIERCSRKR